MSRVRGPALLVGSVPLETVEDVLRACAGELGSFVDAYPDGEVGERINWVFYLAVRTYRGHPKLVPVQDNQGEEIRQPKPGASLAERAGTTLTFRLAPGVRELAFDDLHYAAPAIDSYRVFRRLRDEGTIDHHARFQVALPASGSAVTSFFSEPDEWDIACAAYRAAVAAEISKMLEIIPARDLVVQFDIAVELRDLYLGDARPLPWSPERTVQEKWAWHLADIAPLARAVPEDVALGYHLCFGTWGGWPHTPGVEDLGVCVRLANELVARAERTVDYVHIPVLPDADEAFVAPLADLRLGDTRPYLGLAYHDGAAGSRRRIELVRRHLNDFGVAWYCGFGRLPTEDVAPILREVRASAEELVAAGVGGAR